MEIFTQEGLAMLSRWGHYLAGVTWIGLLYYFNFVQTPSFAGFEAGPRTEAVRKLVPRALWWFRYGALLTLLTGLSILAFQEQLTDGDYYKTPQGISIATGILLAVIMFANVWMVIWPNQKIFIENAERTAAGQEALPNAAAAARKAACASRTNTLFSIPMLFFMGATSHFAALFLEGGGPDGGSRLTYWLVTLVLIVVFEAIALTAPAVGAPQAWHIDNHRNTIIAGFVLALVLILLFEILF
ncbi:MAG TPA: urate hydroxylase PuuD [Acidimicrobiales bacterium]|nr:urate hydroxylase PuuD [Acidimicrobiales bacterium]